MRALVTGGNGLLSKVYGTPRTGSAEVVATVVGKRFNASNRRAREELGWAPRFSLEDSLRDTMATIRANRSAGRRADPRHN